MPITGAIPLPESGADAFFSGATNTQNILSKILQGQQRNQELGETAKYHQGQLGIQQGHLDIAKKAEARAQQTLRYILQNYRDIHGKHASESEMNDIYNGLIKHAYQQALTESNQGNQNGSPMQGNQPNAPIPMQGSNPAETSNMMPSMMQGGGNIPMNPNGMSRQDLVARANQDQGKFDQQYNAQNPGQAPDQAPVQASNQPMMSPQNNNQTGERMIAPARNPQSEAMDVLAGMPKSPFKIQTHFDKNGGLTRIYPSGKVTYTPVSEGKAGETPQEKGQRQLQEKMDLESNKQKEKQATKISESLDPLQQSYRYASELKSILKRRPDLTGKKQWAGVKTGLSEDKDLARFNELTPLLQAQLSKAASSRGGIQALKWAENVKPNAWNQVPYNIGMLDQALKNITNDYNDSTNKYKKLIGKDYPVSRKEFFGSEKGHPDDIVTVEDANGKRMKITRKQAEELGASYG